jgi:septal ring-binding cell division protein DamX
MRVRVVEKQLDGQKRMVLLVGEFVTEPEAQKSISTVRGICKCKAFVVKR